MAKQVLFLFVLGIPVACITWTLTHEEISRELREFCLERSRSCRHVLQRKFFYALTCEYCLSHYVTAGFLFITGFRLLFDSWRGYLIAGLCMVWIANVYMAAFARLRLELKSQKLEIAQEERRNAPKPRALTI
jgi:cytochrome c oxidase assembly factor CtaG